MYCVLDYILGTFTPTYMLSVCSAFKSIVYGISSN